MPLTSSLLYCEPADVVARYDERKVRGYLVDDDFTDPETLVLEESTILTTAIADATAYINLMVQRGARYSIQDIKDYLLVDPDTLADRFPETKAQIVRLCVDLTMMNLMRRRLLSEDVIKATLPSFEMTQETLALLQDGKAIFDMSPAVTASVPSVGGEISGARDQFEMNLNLPSNWNPMFGNFGGRRNYGC